MLKVELNHARPGMVLALPVLHPDLPGHTLLRSGYELEREVLQHLHAVGVRRLWVRYPALDFVSKYVSQEVLQQQAAVVEAITEVFAASQRQSLARIQYDAYCQTIGNMVGSLLNNPQAAVFLEDLSGAEVNGLDLVRHASSVTYLSLLIGLKLEGYLVKQRRHIDPARAKEVVNLGLGAMLHDVGVRFLEPQVRQRYLETADECDPAWGEHPTLGYRHVRMSVEPSAATIVLNHHQRWDGSGYAGAAVPVLSEQRIHVFARIVGLAEQFDRLRALHTRQPRPVVAVLQQLLDPLWRKKFDPQVLITLLTVVPPFPPGSIVRLSDGRWAAVLDHRPSDPCRPQVQPLAGPDRTDEGPSGPPLDLAEEGRYTSIVEYEGQDVTPFNFSAPAFMQDYERVFKAW